MLNTGVNKRNNYGRPDVIYQECQHCQDNQYWGNDTEFVLPYHQVQLFNNENDFFHSEEVKRF
jgi:hypothetical protein